MINLPACTYMLCIMKDKQVIRTTLFLFGFLTVLLAGNARAGVIPVATNSAVIEFAGGLAFDGANYLVGLVSGTNLVGQAISTNGQLAGAPITLGGNPGFPPAAALAGGRTNCLAVWSDASLSSGVTMFAQRVSPSSGLIGSKFALLGSVGSHGFQVVKAAVSDGTNYLVVWQDATSHKYYGQYVTAAGALSGSEFLLFSPSSSSDVAVAYGRTNSLVVVQDGTNNANHVYCMTVSRNGTVGSAVQVDGEASLDHDQPAVGFDGTNYLVVWSHSASWSVAGWPNWDLRGRVVSPAGAGLGSVLEIATDDQASFPALAFDGANHLVVWGHNADTTNTDVTIHGRFLDRSGYAIGPIFEPFTPQGANPPLVPWNGVLFDGNRFLLVATYGSFVLDGGSIIGFSGGDVYATKVDRSTRPPYFTNAGVVDGNMQCQLHVVPGQTYTIQTSTNLVTWASMGTMSSDGTNVLDLVDEEGIAALPRMFCRAVVGNVAGATYSFRFHEFASAGSFGGGYTPVPSYPVTLNSYAAVFEVENEIVPPPATSVFFTGPAGSGLANAAADASNSSIGDNDAVYQTSFISSPAAAPGGAWVVAYKGTNISFTVADPQAASRLVIPLPTATVSGGVLQTVSWGYKNATTGAALSGVPSYLTSIQVQIDGMGSRIYNSPELDAGATSHTLASTINWADVQAIYMAYNDSLGNHYIVMFAKP